MAISNPKLLDTLIKAKLLTLKKIDNAKYLAEKNKFINEIFVPYTEDTLEKYTKEELKTLLDYEELNLELQNKRIEILKRKMEEKNG